MYHIIFRQFSTNNKIKINNITGINLYFTIRGNIYSTAFFIILLYVLGPIFNCIERLQIKRIYTIEKCKKKIFQSVFRLSASVHVTPSDKLSAQKWIISKVLFWLTHRDNTSEKKAIVNNKNKIFSGKKAIPLIYLFQKIDLLLLGSCTRLSCTLIR